MKREKTESLQQKKDNHKNGDKKLSIEELLSKLESIVKKLENEDLELEKAIQLYSEGIRVSQEASHLLQTAKLKVEELSKEVRKSLSLNNDNFDDGEEEFDE